MTLKKGHDTPPAHKQPFCFKYELVISLYYIFMALTSKLGRSDIMIFMHLFKLIGGGGYYIHLKIDYVKI